MSQDLPPLPALRAFEAAARLGSVSRAAGELHVTHGAVSRHVRTLEDALGLPLFARQGRGLVLTEAGERLREASGDAFGRLREAWRDLRRRPAHAPLVLGCSGSLLARWVIPRLARLGEALPQLTLHLSATEHAPGPELAGLDAALLLAAPPWPAGWQVHALGPERIGPVLSPRMAGADAHVPAGRIATLPLLGTRSRPQAWPQWAHAHGIAPEALPIANDFEHLLYLLEAAVAGLGVAIAPQPLVADDLASGRLIAPWGFVQTSAQWVLCADARNTDRRIDALAEWLRHELGAERPPS
ncbi:LysR family transcriptional regulator [Stenotrophomonas sp. HITSZ_GD]|uniref:LysR family transcriptional regulator n=1 Tax=Stenotrophomonas sp. HITSZ_GD TaxID=3037248 RepID=UPI00240E483B|nr:LysR family transcriptional regulator [Stenotrophomonas sp. HITSZ_GD]MDG2524519.1 LysR family transcriptional regulator [Stenotrophomonas sp. HITSZ_GD]